MNPNHYGKGPKGGQFAPKDVQGFFGTFQDKSGALHEVRGTYLNGKAFLASYKDDGTGRTVQGYKGEVTADGKVLHTTKELPDSHPSRAVVLAAVEKLRASGGTPTALAPPPRRATVPAPPARPVPQNKPVLEKALRSLEADLRPRATERLHLVDRATGKVLHTKDGTSGYVMTSDKEMALSRDNVLTHNHPTYLPLSAGDVLLAVKWNQAEVRAVAHDPKTGTNVLYRAVRPSGGWPTEDHLTTAIQAATKRVENNGYATQEQRNHEEWLHAAAIAGFHYERVEVR